MAVACGANFTAVVTKQGELWTFGSSEQGQSGLGSTDHQRLPALVGGQSFFKHPVFMVAAGCAHAACVTSNGVLYTWGRGDDGQLGDGLKTMRMIPVPISTALYGGSSAIAVACGKDHTVLLTKAGCVWTCGDGQWGKLGHGDQTSRLILKLVDMSNESLPNRVCMVAAGYHHTVALTSQGKVFTWGRAKYGCLGVKEHSFESAIVCHEVPTRVARSSILEDQWFAGKQPVMIAAGGDHTVVVMGTGNPWVWGKGGHGQLGLGGRDDVYSPQELQLGAFLDSHVLSASCGPHNTLFLTTSGLWTCGDNGDHTLGYTVHNGVGLVPTCIEQQHFEDTRIVCAAVGPSHTVAVNESGRLFTWGEADSDISWFKRDENGKDLQVHQIFPGAIGHTNVQGGYISTPVRLHGFQSAQVGSLHAISTLHALAFAMCTHPRLGNLVDAKRSQYREVCGCRWGFMSSNLVHLIVQMCNTYPNGVIRLLGGDIF